MKKSVIGIHTAPPGHWVGDGFPVRSLFSYERLGAQLSPFLLLDYAGPAEFAPAARPRGVGEHPHRGFETVTIVYQGEVAHRDSTGQGGLIGPGDVQWMTAAGGILHEEYHSPAFTRRGGMLEMAQLWVNLPAQHKMSAPRYQTIVDAAIPRVGLDTGATARIIAGRHGDARGPAGTFSPLNVWDVRQGGGRSTSWTIPDGHSAAIAVLRGRVSVNGSAAVSGVGLVVLGTAGDEIEVESSSDSILLFLSGEPIPEPIVGYGPFVMNTRAEIEAAMTDFRSGRFGRIAAPANA